MALGGKKSMAPWQRATALTPLVVLVAAWVVSLGSPGMVTARPSVHEPDVPIGRATSPDQVSADAVLQPSTTPRPTSDFSPPPPAPSATWQATETNDGTSSTEPVNLVGSVVRSGR